MSKKVNATKKKTPQSHLNHMNGLSFDIKNPLVVLRMMAASCFFGEPSYYESKEPPKTNALEKFPMLEQLLGPYFLGHELDSFDSALEKAIDEALDFNLEDTLKIAAALRNEDFIRVTPQIILVRASHHPSSKGTSLIRQYARDILQRGDEPALGLAYHSVCFKNKPIPNSLKKAWKEFLENQSEYSLAKYKMTSRYKKTVDVVNVCHAKSPAVDKLMKGELKLEERTWESLISTKGSNATSWKQALDEFLLNPKGHMALLRNLRNLHEHKLVTPKVLEALKNGVQDGKQLPFRYWSAFKAMEALDDISTSPVLDAIEDCLNLSVKNVPSLKGRVMSLCDNSGSAQGTTTSELGSVKVSEIANLTGILTAKTADEGYTAIFGDKLKEFSIRKNSSVMDDLKLMNSAANSIGSGTENGIWLFWKNAIAKKEHWDHVFVYSDMQAGQGELYGEDPSEYKNYLWGPRMINVPALIAKYRKEVNPNVMVYLVQVAGYKDTIVPHNFDKTVILGGWGPGILSYAAKLAEIASKP